MNTEEQARMSVEAFGRLKGVLVKLHMADSTSARGKIVGLVYAPIKIGEKPDLRKKDCETILLPTFIHLENDPPESYPIASVRAIELLEPLLSM